MYGRGTLAATGVGLTILGMKVSLSLIAGFAVLTVVAGLAAYRYANRNKRYGQ